MNIITNYILQNKISKYKFSKQCDIPYTTINDICNEKTSLQNCSAETIYKLSGATGISCDDLLGSAFAPQEDFENFKSNVCHAVRYIGDIQFIEGLLESNVIRHYFIQLRYKESLYLLGMLDYLSRKHDVMLCSDYDDLRQYRFEKPIYSNSLLARAAVARDDSIKEDAVKNAIPEFIRFNIVENEVENVC